MALTITDFVGTAGRKGVYVRLVDNTTGAVFVSTLPTDSNGQFTMQSNPPPADYSAYTSAVNGPPWVLYDPHYRINFTRGDALFDRGGQLFNVQTYGAKFDSRTVTDVATTAGSPIISSATANFTSADVGKLFGCKTVGAAGQGFHSTILSVQSTTQATLASNVPNSGSGIQANIASDDKQAFLDALADMAAKSGSFPTGRVLYLPTARYSISGQLPTSMQGITVAGDGRSLGSLIDFYGATSLFELGSDNGLPWDGNYYNGVETFTLRDLTIQAAYPTALLDNGQFPYTPGSMVVRDWRGGDQVWERVTINNFDYPFWGVQSDLNKWDHVKIFACHSGVYQGPRSDQWTAEDSYWIYCDRALDIDRAQNPTFHRCYFVDNGAVGTNPIKIHSAWTSAPQWGASFDDCWFEQYLGVAAALEAFIEIGVGDTLTAEELHIRNPQILTNGSGFGPHIQYLVKVGNASHIKIEEPTAQIFNIGTPGTAGAIDALVSCVAATSPDILIVAPKSFLLGGGKFGTVVTSGGATPNVFIETWGTNTGRNAWNGQVTIGNDALAADVNLNLDSAVGRNRQIGFQTAGILRFIERVDNSAESGADAGSNMSLLARHDDGSASRVIWTITRNTGVVQFGNKIWPATDAGAQQSSAGFYGNVGAPNNANGANGDFYFRSDGGAATTIYQRRAGAWVGVV